MATMNVRALCLSVAIVFSLLSRQPLAAGEGSKEADKIAALPGQPPDAVVQQYSGYVNIDDKAGKSLFYYFVEASADAAQKPLLLWLNGGPGCSSFGIGAFQEIGPFRVDTDGKTLCKNKYAWNTVSNVLYLESPVGVGFSYAVNTEVYNTMGDNMTAHDSYLFLLKWLDRFPEYKARDLFIVGESYAGHYVPELAVAILLARSMRPKDSPINLKGIAIGNGILELASDQSSMFEYLWQHAFMSDSAHALIAQNCRNADDESPLCQGARNSAYGHLGNIDVYNVYASTCHDKKVRPSGSKCMDLADPCAQYYVEAYLNQPQVQKAIHANAGLKYPWTRCRTYNLNTFGDSPKKTMLPYIKAIAASGVRVWLFSGDLDAMVPVISTRQAVEKLGLGVAADWRPWSADGKEVAGYVIEYKGVVFATVRGSGHMVPIDQPERGLVLVSSFIKGQPLPQATPMLE
ncbi:serine carboxypeptidase 1-like [Phragmites australis]|uniref:serine carboxypeptidase 1-like n=1 Tax=Phragmites australis TaxID=29695 RepID=UPI002D77F80E|nr:serine carboxypeptidase 1-like [Phragmites australis]